MAAWGETSEQEEDSQEEEVAEALMAKACPNLRIQYVVLAKLKL